MLSLVFKQSSEINSWKHSHETQHIHQCDASSALSERQSTSVGGCSNRYSLEVLCDGYSEPTTPKAPECTNGQTRLVPGANNRGNVQHCSGGVWRSLCGTGSTWRNREARVVCRQLGYRSGSGEMCELKSNNIL